MTNIIDIAASAKAKAEAAEEVKKKIPPKCNFIIEYKDANDKQMFETVTGYLGFNPPFLVVIDKDDPNNTEFEDNSFMVMLEHVRSVKRQAIVKAS